MARNGMAPLHGKTAVITGGSKGIGRATAVEFARLGANVCILARDAGKLAEAARAIRAAVVPGESAPGKEAGPPAFVETIEADATDYEGLKRLLDAFVSARGVPDYLVNCVGYAVPRRIRELSPEDFTDNMKVNYFGQLNPILALLPAFMDAKKGHIATCSSAAGFLGLMGYAAYTPTKYAIAGLSEVLRHELKPAGIRVSVLYPPDTDTPGFEAENRTKPAELHAMSEGGGLLTPEAVGRIFVKGIMRRKYYIMPGQSALMWRIARHAPLLMHAILDGEYAKACKKVANGYLRA